MLSLTQVVIQTFHLLCHLRAQRERELNVQLHIRIDELAVGTKWVDVVEDSYCTSSLDVQLTEAA